jgi:hypothetical protein
MAYLNTCTELDDLGKGRFRHVHHIKPIAYLENGVYKLSSANVAAYADGTYTHAVLAANIGVRIGNDGKYAIHPTRELARYVAFGGPQVKVGGKWTAVPFDKPVRKGNTVVWTREQADLKLTHIGHGLKHEMWLKKGYVPEGNLIAVAVNLVGLTRSGSTLLADGVPVARIQAPVVYDADNREDTRPIKWDVVARDGQPYIVYALPDLTGMTAPVVDPTLTLQPDAAAGKDTAISGVVPTRNGGASTSFIGRPSDRRVGLIEFDLSAIPASAGCTSATLYLYQTQVDVNLPGTTSIYSIASGNAAWIEGVGTLAGNALAGEPCYNALEADGAGGVTTAWAGSAGLSTADTDYESPAIGSAATNRADAVGTEYSFALTAARVQGWFGATNTNYGIMVHADASSPYFGMSDHATASYRPKLVVDYTLPSSGGMLLLGVG